MERGFKNSSSRIRPGWVGLRLFGSMAVSLRVKRGFDLNVFRAAIPAEGKAPVWVEGDAVFAVGVADAGFRFDRGDPMEAFEALCGIEEVELPFQLRHELGGEFFSHRM